MSVSIVVGNVTLNAADLPEKITLGGDLDSQEIALSDGSSYLSVTGWKPVHLAWSGCIYTHDSQGDPIAKAEAIEAQQRQGTPVTIIWHGGRITRSWTATIQQWHWSPVRDGDAEYSIDLVRATDGGLLAGAQPRPPSRTRRIHDSLTAIGAQASAVGPQTNAAWQTAMAARSQIPRGDT